MSKKPYTKKEIVKMKCFRCKDSARFQWQICSDNNIYRPLCPKCDIELNKMVLKWTGIKNWKDKIVAYKKYVYGK